MEIPDLSAYLKLSHHVTYYHIKLLMIYCYIVNKIKSHFGIPGEIRSLVQGSGLCMVDYGQREWCVVSSGRACLPQI